MLSIDGLISGINTESIINGLVSLQQRQVDRLTFRQDNIRVQQQALQGVEGRLLSLRASMSALNRTGNSVFASRQVSSSQEGIISATASSRANVGSYSLRVTSRATAHQLGSNGFTDGSESITTGTISFQVGDRPVTEIVIDESNNTVEGLVQAINTQSNDVTASIVRDQASNSSRILLTSKHTGASNQITINNQLGTIDGIARPDFSGPSVTAAANATVQLGSGEGAIVAQYDTNQIDGLITGVTLNLLSVNPDQDVTITVSRDSSQAETAIRDFVKQFNELIEYIDDQTRFDAATETAGPLLGNRNVNNLKNQLLSMVTGTVPGVSGGLNRMSQLGVTIDGNARLSINSARLSSALAGNVQGISIDDVPRLFGLTGSSSNSRIEFVLGSSRTQVLAEPIEVEILQAAQRGSLLGSNPLDETIEINHTNNQFSLKLDGIGSETLTLSEGTYTRNELAQHLQSVINSSSTLGNRQVRVSLENDRLRITSEAFGSNSRLSEFNGSALATLGLTGTEEGVGVDVAGRFIVNGQTENAVGTGRILAGDPNNPFTADLQVRVTLQPDQVADGIDGQLMISRGVTGTLDQFLARFLDSNNGGLATAKQSFERQIESIESSINRVNEISEAKREFLVRQFASLERALSSLQSTSSIIASQLAQIQRQ